MAVTLPYDIARCPNSNCEQAQNCKRFLAPGRPDGHQVFMLYPLWPECDGHIPVKKESSNE